MTVLDLSRNILYWKSKITIYCY